MVVGYIESSSASLTDILHKPNLWDEWLNKFEKEKLPVTTRSYFRSLAKFYSFLKCENIDMNFFVRTVDQFDRPNEALGQLL